jgi:hypothetical protein
MLVLSSGSYTPQVPLTELWTAEDGMKLSTEGVVVDFWIRDGGEGSLWISDLASGASARILLPPLSSASGGIAPAIGDEIGVTGRYSNRLGTPAIFADWEEMRITRHSEDVLTVASLARNWMLFLNDPIRLRGILYWDSTGNPRLRDPSSDVSLAIQDASSVLTGQVMGAFAEVTGRLLFDERQSRLVFLLEQVRWA